MATSARSTSKAPVGKVAVDLDTLENEKVFEPFAFRVKGRRIVLIPPAELDWQVSATLDARNPHAFFGATMKSEDFDFWVSQPEMPNWKIEILVDEYRKHFGLPDPASGE